ncbi:MAG: sigma 54-interacting transcriptional regulator [Candidatus Eisenbacteria sp.]|nr:sigma 54-interacting transcriptional regulator [Candidatus Eisenbacteria bacterium]
MLRVASVHQAADNPIAALEALEQAAVLFAEASAPIALRAEVMLKTADCLRRRGLLEEALEQATAVLSLIGSAGGAVLRGRALSRLGDIQGGLGRYDEALAACEEAYQLLRSTDEHADIGFLELARGTIHVRRGEVVRSRECFESALFSFRRIDDREGIALALNALGLALKNGPHWADARDFLTRALAVSEAAGNYTRVATHSVNLGILYTKLCDFELAAHHLDRSVSINREVGNSYALVKALLAKGLMYRRCGQLERAAALYGEALELCTEHGYGRELVLGHEFEGELLGDQGRFADARSRLNAGLDLALEVAPEGDLVPEIKRRLAQFALAEGQAENARQLAREALRGARRLGDNTEAGVALRILGEASARLGHEMAARRLLERSLGLLERTPERFEQALSQVALARQLARLWSSDREAAGEGSPERAVDLIQKAWAFFAGVDLQEKATEVLVDLADVRLVLGQLDDALRDIARASALAEQVGRRDLLRRLESLRERLEEHSARTARLATPEADLIAEWAKLFGDNQASEACLQKMLQFVAQRLESSSAMIAAPDGQGGHCIEAAVGLAPEAAARILPIVAPLVGSNGICLATELSADPRFSAHADRTLAGVCALAALAVRLPEGEGILYLDRRDAGARPFGASALHMLSLLTGLLGLGLVQVRREREIERSRRSRLDATSVGPFADYLTSHLPLKQMFTHLARVGESPASILILGETGTGKGLLAQCIHSASSRRERPFVTVNCAALPEPLLESELFGHVQGSFTGAHRSKRGLFEAADGGTLLLDEISRASLAVQAKLLHVLDSKEVRPVGATQGKRVDVRVLCASNADLREAIRQGQFLEDLFYRLNDFSVLLPPLRDRREDIPLLLTHFYDEACREMGRRPKGIAREVMSLLLDHQWRGNIRELLQVVRRLVALSEDGAWITTDLLPADFASATPAVVPPAGAPIPVGTNGGGLHGAVEQLEKKILAAALTESGWNRSEVARRLEISYPTVLAKIKRYRLHPPEGSASR